MYNAVVIGGGFYGATLALHLAAKRGGEILLLEQEAALMQRASRTNQARIHNGHHYPRSFTTAHRCRVNLVRFVQARPQAVARDFCSVYAIARRNSKVSARQFRRFCEQIGAPVAPAPAHIRTLFEPRLIEDVFVAEEYLFDARALATAVETDLRASGIDVQLGMKVVGLAQQAASGLTVSCVDRAGVAHTFDAAMVLNCTYAGLNHLGGGFPGTQAQIKHELTEMVAVRLPAQFANLGVTVMDGPFFSLLPMPQRSEHSLSHVRYTPHFQWLDVKGRDPYAELSGHPPGSRAHLMLRDIARYMPALAAAQPVESMFEIKTLLARNETDDGRPILLERHASMPNCISVLGGKIDNVFDVIEKLDEDSLHGRR